MKNAAAILLLILAGCATPEARKLILPTAAEVKAADYGKNPAEYKLTIGKFMLLRMVQPSGAKYKFKNEPRKKWIPGVSRPQFGYGVCADIAAPLGGGKFEKFRSFFFLIKNKTIIFFLEKPAKFYCLPIAAPAKTASNSPDRKT